MAVPSLAPASIALFQRIPDRLFGPLASANRHGYWSLLCHLHRRRFGPDAPLPPSYGFLQREITQEIEDHLKYADEWQPESGDQPDTPMNIRAIGIFNRLVEAGWFRLEKYGIEKTVNMAPAVSQLLTQLINFAETGPVFVSGKIRAIDAAVAQVHKGEASGDLLREAAEQCRNLLVYIRNTGTNVRDLMAAIGAEPTTAQYVRSFFTSYIQEVFIGDYQELRTREHPLSKRQQILDAVTDIDTQPEQRSRLLDWYVNRLSSGDDKRGQAAFQRDLQRLYELDRIEEYLERLDEEIRVANRRALAFLEYKLRAIRPIDNLLAQPRKEVPRQAPTPLRQVIISDRTRAIGNLVRRAQERRSITPMKLRAYAEKVLKDTAVADSDVLPCGSIEDLRAFQALTSVAMATNSKIARLEMEGRASAPGMELRYTSDEAAEHPYLSGKAFTLSWRKRQTKNREPK